MVKEITIAPDFRPGFVEVGGKIPKFQYQKTLKQELKEGNLTKEMCLDFLKCMLLIRNLEEMIRELNENKGRYGPVKYLYSGASHISIGQEAIPTGAMAAISVSDYITSSHRGHGDGLAKGYFALKEMRDTDLAKLIKSKEKISRYLEISVNNKNHEELLEGALRIYLYRIIAELFGKEEGCCKGRGGGMHIADFSKGHLGANAIVGGSLAMAVGAAIASRNLQDKKVVICLAGDGAFNNGIAHEAMNMATMAQFTNGLMSKEFGVPAIFAIINNQYGMTGQQRGEVTGIDFLAERGFGYDKEGMHAQIVNGMDVLAVMDATRKAVKRARDGKGPMLLEFWCSRYKGHSLSDRLDKKEDETYRTMKELEAWQEIDPVRTFSHKLIKEAVISEKDLTHLKKKARQRNEDMALKAMDSPSPDPKNIYFGLFSNTNSNEVPPQFRNAPILKKPEFLQRDPDMEITCREAINEALFEEMRRDKRVLLWGEDIADYGGAFNATRGLMEIMGRERVFNTAISESAIIGAGMGAALRGMRPVVEIMYIDFILQAMDQLANQAAKWKYMSGGQPTIPLTIRTTIGGGKGYAGQHAQSLEAILAHFPGLKIALPSHAYDAKGMLKAAIRDDNPVIVIEHQNLYRHPFGKSVVPKEEYVVPLGKAKIRRQLDESKNGVTVISWSYMVSLALQAAEQLSKEGIETEVIDLRTLYPLDIETLVKSVQKTGKVVIVHQAVRFMGFGAEVAAQLQEKAFDYLDSPVLRVAAPDVPPPAAPVLEKAFLPGEEEIIEAVKKLT
ncbi:pyruvate dehydrogenase [Candidatus Aerophobetes bacterium Ae_b3a]|nr:MAG: pyruvate dehydrogenase [Candidatus Aerophobetes bacterium Ae_b3a]